MSWIHLPDAATPHKTVLMVTEDGRRLGFAVADRSSRLYLWSREHGADEGERWVQNSVVELGTLLPAHALSSRAQVAGFSGNGVGVIFIRTWADGSFFTFDLKSGRRKRVGDSRVFNGNISNVNHNFVKTRANHSKKVV